VEKEEKVTAAVFKLVEYSCRDTISVLKVLLSLALKGKLRGLLVCYRDDDGREDTVFTGIYKESRSSMLNASLRVSMDQLRNRGEID
jgi:hypothetical protein